MHTSLRNNGTHQLIPIEDAGELGDLTFIFAPLEKGYSTCLFLIRGDWMILRLWHIDGTPPTYSAMNIRTLEKWNREGNWRQQSKVIVFSAYIQMLANHYGYEMVPRTERDV